MPETFLNNAQLSGLDRDARRTEILRAKNFNALDARVDTLDASLNALDARVTVNEGELDLFTLGAWTSWTPTVTQSGSVTVTNTRSRYARYGRTIVFTFDLAVTGSGTASNAIIISLPFTADSTNSINGGGGYLNDVSTSTIHPFLIFPTNTTAFRLKATAVATSSGLLGQAGFTAGLASGDVLRGTGIYEAAA